MTITVEILNDKVLKLLKNLEQLKLLRLRLPKKKGSPKTVIEPLGKDIEQVEAMENFETGIIKHLRKDLTLHELLEEQHFKGFDRKELDKLAKEINIQEPIEELLAMLKP
jgi:hypothetical protein